MSRLPAVATFAAVVAAGASATAQLPDLEAPSAAEVELGRLLFWDPVLSGEQDVACATCHHPDYAYGDGRALSLGPQAVGLGPGRVDRSGGEVPVVKRNAQTVLNTVYNGVRERRRRRGQERRPARLDLDGAPMFWDGRVRSLETQALEPLKAFEEMRGGAYEEEVAVDSVVARLRAVPEYVRRFGEAFGPGSLDAEALASALAAFQRSLVAVDSPWDRFQRGDSSAMTARQIQGMETFDRVGCDRCHDGPMFSDFRMHAEGVAEHPLLAEPDTGTGRFEFRTPTLRNVALTAPYMHNGMLPTLEDVLRFYDNGRSENPNVADRGRRRGGERGVARVAGQFRRVRDMSDGQIEDIVAFLHALTDDRFDRRVPGRVPSGLRPGGRIGS
jgi:cytochrome c peroxidase